MSASKMPKSQQPAIQLHQVLFGKTENHLQQLLRSFVASFVSFSLDFLTLLLLKRYIYLTAAAAIGFITGTVLVFILNKYWVFPRQRYSSLATQFSVFFSFALSGSLMYTLLFAAFSGPLRLHFALAKTTASLLVFIFNFLTRKFFLFAAKRKSRPNSA
ncbi:MAG: GtrA family protein [Spirochaetes bacterium]|nr:GtrA family protein [Spirochaetota bacterium]MBU0955536.1 GtrA family protein [Spirochaetota bacterium]